MATLTSRRGAMAREVYEGLVESFRKAPGKFKTAARLAGVDRRTARKAWEVGLPYPWASTPIKEIIAQDQREARAMLAAGTVTVPPGSAGDALAAAVAEQRAHAGAAAGPAPRPDPTANAGTTATLARNDAAQALAQEALLVRGARGNVVALLALTTRMLRTLTPLWEQWCRDLAADPSKVNADLLLRLFRSLTIASRDQVSTAEVVMELERAKLGAGDSDDVNMPLDQAADQIMKAHEALRKAQQIGLVGAPNLVAIPGGKSAKAEGE